MRCALVVANWKLNKTVAEALAFAEALAAAYVPHEGLTLVVAPPATALHPLREPLARLGVALGAQGAHPMDAGAYTGALSAPLLAEAGARYLLVGHCERRALFGERPEVTHALVQAAGRAGLAPLLCVGESQADRAAGRHLDEVQAQLTAALGQGGEVPANLVVAYEPVWAIGAGRGAEVPQVEEVHRALRRALVARLGGARGNATPVLYGGSVAAKNVAAFAESPHVDGVLVGGASLQADTLAALCAEVARVR